MPISSSARFGRRDGSRRGELPLPESLLESELFATSARSLTPRPRSAAVRGGRPGDAAARRGRRDAPRDAGQAAQGARGDDLPAARRHARPLRRRAHRRRHEQGARGRGGARRVPPRPLPPPRRVPHPRPAAARPARGHHAARPALPGPVRRQDAQAGGALRARDREAARRLRLPRQRARASAT